jgi:RHS repeat-associated protein
VALPHGNWDHYDFGNNAPNQNPFGLGTFIYNQRFEDQYNDSESGINYNYLSDCYNPVIGRYCQFDPIGLAGGINGYAYVESNPLTKIDPFGLIQWTIMIGYGPGIILTWGENSGQLNVGAFVGVGGGETPISISYDPNEFRLSPHRYGIRHRRKW